MLVKNYYSVINNAFSSNSVTVKEIEQGRDVSANVGFVARNNNSILIRYGSGDRAESVDDYKLAEEIGTAKGTTVQTENSISVNGFIINSGSETVIIKEIGISVEIKVTGTTYATILFSRTVLNESIELLPGDMVAINTQFV